MRLPYLHPLPRRHVLPSASGCLPLPAQGPGRDHLGKGLHESDRRLAAISEFPQNGSPGILLAHHLKKLKLPTFLREHEKLARHCAAENLDHTRFLLRLAELDRKSTRLNSSH